MSAKSIPARTSPVLRFGEFEQRTDWQTRKLGEICKITTGKLDANAMSPNGRYRFYTCAKDFLAIDNYAFDTEALLISGNGANVGYIHYYKGKFNAYQRTYVLDEFTESIHFIKFQLEIKLRKRIQLESKAGNIPYIVMDTLAGMGLTLPALPEQQKIADFLTAIDERIQQLSQKKTLLEDYKKGVMQQLFTQALRFKDDQGNEFPDWEETKLGDAVTVNPKTPEPPDSFIYIDLESVNAGALHSPRRILKVSAPSRAQRLLQRGDILYQTVRPYQMNNYLFDLEDVHVASTGYAQLRASRNNARFIYHSLHLPRFVGDVMDRCTGTSYPAINSKDLAEIEISIPSLPEQSKIANFLTALDLKSESVATQITLTESFKKGLLQQMFV